MTHTDREEPGSPEEEHPSGDPSPRSQPPRPPVGRVGGLGCLGMTLAALLALFLVTTGNFYAVAAGIAIFAVALGVGMWLYNEGSREQK